MRIEKKWSTSAEKQAAVTEYLNGGTTYKSVGKKYGFTHTAVCKWVAAYYATKAKSDPDLKVPRKYERPAVKKEPGKQDPLPPEILPKQVRRLQAELHKVRLHNQLLQSMIEIAEKDLGIAIRKKSGTKRS